MQPGGRTTFPLRETRSILTTTRGSPVWMTNDVGPKTPAVSVNRSLLADAGNVNGGFDVSPIFRAPFFRERVIVFATATTTSGKARLLTSRRGLPTKTSQPRRRSGCRVQTPLDRHPGTARHHASRSPPRPLSLFLRDPGHFSICLGRPLIVAVLWIAVTIRGTDQLAHN